MVYTVAQLGKISGVSIRTLHWYDEIGLLKPAYHGANGYRFYEEEQLLALQQILFFRELGFELKQIESILKRTDFDRVSVLKSHRQVLMKNIERTKKLIKTIDTTIEHINGIKKMKDQEMYLGFSKEKQNEYQEYLIHRFGEKAKKSIAESVVNVKKMSKESFEKNQQDWEGICKDLSKQLKNQTAASSPEVQRIIQRHYELIQRYWTPNQSAYISLGEQYISFEWKQAFETYDPEHPKLAQYLAQAMKVFAEKNLT